MLSRNVLHDGFGAPLREITPCTQWDDRAAHTLTIGFLLPLFDAKMDEGNAG